MISRGAWRVPQVDAFNAFIAGPVAQFVAAASKLDLAETEKQAKLAAIRTVLEYTKSKPESRSKVTVSTSEQFLAEIAALEDGG